MTVPAWEVSCPTCAASPGKSCVLPVTGEALPRSRTHYKRVRKFRELVLAREAAKELE